MYRGGVKKGKQLVLLPVKDNRFFAQQHVRDGQKTEVRREGQGTVTATNRGFPVSILEKEEQKTQSLTVS